MEMEKELSLEFVRVVEEAAIDSARTMGRGDRTLADQAAVQTMRRVLDTVPMAATIVIGEGERDEAPMLYIGELVGNKNGPEVDIALDPLEGTNLCATGAPNALSVIAMAERGNFLHAPDTYMDKIAVGNVGKGIIDITKSPTENLNRLADTKRCRVEDLTVVILDRDRHSHLIQEVRRCGARIKLIGDGDVSAALAACIPGSGVDLLLGIGGAPEGVIAAAALRCLEGDMQGQLKFRNEKEKERAQRMGVTDFDRVYKLEDLAKGEVMFAATGVTDGDFLKGVHFFGGGAKTQSLVMRSKTRTIRYIAAEHHFDFKPNY